MDIPETMMNFIEEPEAMHELIDYLTDWELEYADKVCRYLKPDALLPSRRLGYPDLHLHLSRYV